MNLEPLHRPVAGPDLSLDQVASSTRLEEKEKVARASQAFEALLLRQILTDAQKSQFGPETSGNRTSAEIYQDMISERLAEHIASSGSFGLARSLETQLQRQLKTAGSGPPATTGPGLRHSTQIHLPSHD